MSERITIKNARRALAYYGRLLAGHGWSAADQLEIATPYGAVYYVVTRGEKWTVKHDVPGFQSDSIGFVSVRDLYDAIQQARRTASDVFNLTGSEWDSEEAGRVHVVLLDRFGLGSEVHPEERARVTA